MEKQDLTFRSDLGMFTFRVGAIIIHNNRVLMVKYNKGQGYYTVGGKVKLHESSEQAVIREVLEETGIELLIDRLAFIHEYFFEEPDTKDLQHQIEFHYLMKVNNEIKHICENELRKKGLYWLPISKLKETHLYPSFFKTKLLGNLDCVQHIVSR